MNYTGPTALPLPFVNEICIWVSNIHKIVASNRTHCSWFGLVAYMPERLRVCDGVGVSLSVTPEEQTERTGNSLSHELGWSLYCPINFGYYYSMRLNAVTMMLLQWQ